jgi:hypothetical protein
MVSCRSLFLKNLGTDRFLLIDTVFFVPTISPKHYTLVFVLVRGTLNLMSFNSSLIFFFLICCTCSQSRYWRMETTCGGMMYVSLKLTFCNGCRIYVSLPILSSYYPCMSAYDLQSFMLLALFMTHTMPLAVIVVED